jgi:hypothetical protein
MATNEEDPRKRECLEQKWQGKNGFEECSRDGDEGTMEQRYL